MTEKEMHRLSVIAALVNLGLYDHVLLLAPTSTCLDVYADLILQELDNAKYLHRTAEIKTKTAIIRFWYEGQQAWANLRGTQWDMIALVGIEKPQVRTMDFISNIKLYLRMGPDPLFIGD